LAREYFADHTLAEGRRVVPRVSPVLVDRVLRRMVAQEAAVRRAEIVIDTAYARVRDLLEKVDTYPGGYLGGNVPSPLLRNYGLAMDAEAAAERRARELVGTWGFADVNQWRASYAVVRAAAARR
jgi:hypothetical protein